MTNREQNLSSRNAFARFMLGSVMTAYGTARLMRNPKSRSGQMLVLFGSMKAAEGATKYCPTKAMSSNMMQKMMSGSASQDALAGAGAAMNNGTQSDQSASSDTTGQTGGSIRQMVGNIAQKLTGGNSSQSMSGGNSQNASGGNIAQTIGNVAQQMTSGTGSQTISNIAQTVAPQVGQIMNNVAGTTTGSQNTSGTNNSGKQASSMSGSSNKNASANANANTKNATNGTSNETKNANTNNKNAKSASNNSGNNQASAANGNNTPTADATKPLLDGAANKANVSDVAASVINGSSKTANKNAPISDILQ